MSLMNKTHIYRLKTGEEIRWKGNHHGFVLVYAGRNQYDQRVYEIRKSTPDQRKAMILTHIRENDNKPFKIHWLAEKLGVSDRTIQSDIRFFEKKKFITSTPTYGKDGRQNGYIYHCNVKQDIGVGAQNSIKALYQMSNPIAYRTWDWEDFRIRYGMEAYEIESVYDELDCLKQEQRNKQISYLKSKIKKRVKRAKKEEMEM